MKTIERIAARKVVDALLDAGYQISVYNGEDETREFDNAEKVMEALCTTDTDTLRVSNGGTTPVGSAWLVWGNGEDLLSDYSMTLHDTLGPLVG